METQKNKYIPSNELFKDKENQWKLNDTEEGIYIFADHLKTPENMGAIIRLADNLSAKQVFFIQDDPNFAIRDNKIKKASGSSHHHMPYIQIKSNEIDQYIPKGFQKVAIETSSKARCIYETELPRQCAFFLGSEKFGMRQELIEEMDLCVYIPIPGNTKSLNVSHSLSIAAFEWYRQLKFDK